MVKCIYIVLFFCFTLSAQFTGFNKNDTFNKFGAESVVAASPSVDTTPPTGTIAVTLIPFDSATVTLNFGGTADLANWSVKVYDEVSGGTLTTLESGTDTTGDNTNNYDLYGVSFDARYDSLVFMLSMTDTAANDTAFYDTVFANAYRTVAVDTADTTQSLATAMRLYFSRKGGTRFDSLFIKSGDFDLTQQANDTVFVYLDTLNWDGDTLNVSSKYVFGDSLGGLGDSVQYPADAVGGGGGADLWSNNFEGSGNTLTFSGTGNDTDYTAVTITGTASYRLDNSGSGNPSSISAYWDTTSNSTTYFRFSLRFLGGLPGSNVLLWQCLANETGNPQGCISLTWRSGGFLRLSDGVAYNVDTGAISADTDYYIWIEYTPGTGANGVFTLYHGTSTTKPSATGTVTASSRTWRARWHGFYNQAGTEDFIFDDIDVATSDQGNF